MRIEKKIDNKIMMSKNIKWNIEEYIKEEYDVVCYMDCNRIPDINRKIEYKNYINILKEKDFIMTKHPSKRCIYKEGKEVIKQKKDTEENVNKNINYLRSVKYPKYNGLFANGFFVRKIGNERYKEVMKELINFMMDKSWRDQLAVNYIFWKNNIKNYIENNFRDVPVIVIGKFKHVYI